MRVLVVDDQADMRSYLKRVLEAVGIDCTEAENAKVARAILSDGSVSAFDVILLDVEMPGPSGWDLIVEMRELGDETPVIFVTAASKVDEKVRALRMGADDYMVKPFEPEELIARIEAVVRRRRAMPMLQLGEITIDLGRRHVRRGDRRLEVSPREFDLLRVLAEAKGAVVSRAELLRQVWSLDRDPGTNLVEVLVTRLRRKIDEPGDTLIQNLVGKGYRMSTSPPR